jgi:hypothetical protein
VRPSIEGTSASLTRKGHAPTRNHE